MLDAINPPTSPPYDSGANTPLLSSQADGIPPSDPVQPPAISLDSPSDTTTSSTSPQTQQQQGEDDDPALKRHKPGPVAGKKPSAEALQRRKEGRIKAAATLAQNLAKTGIGRFETENGFGLTSVKTIPLINQKNYFTEYLKKDEQVGFIRNWRHERALQQKLKKLKQDQAAAQGQAQSQGQTPGVLTPLNGAGDKKGEIRNFDDFNLNEIEAEMKKEMTAEVVVDDDEDDDEENETEEIREEKAKIGEDVIILQPGTRYIRIGKATDAVPMVVPNVIAVRKDGKVPKTDEIMPARQLDDGDGDIVIDEDFDAQKAVMTKDFRARMRFYKRRVLPNSRETVSNFNRKREPEKIHDHNDPNKKEWIKGEKEFYVGEDALKLVLNDGWVLRHPMINGNFNEYSYDYESREEVLGDLANIIKVCLEQLEISNIPKLKVMLLIPDLYDKSYVETWVELLFKFVGFGRVGILQEAVAATFGATASTACIVDVGAQTTKISCVDEGMIINDSRILLNYGGDNITETFIKLTLEDQFPYKDINLIDSYDWELAQELKEKFITFQDADIAVQLYDFYMRHPFKQTEKYEFKVFDEVMLAPMGLFFPKIFQLGKKKPSIPNYHASAVSNKLTVDRLFPKSLDQYTSKPNNPSSKSQEELRRQLNYCDLTDEELLLKLTGEEIPKDATTEGDERLYDVPLEKAIIESITNAGLSSDLSKIKKYYDNILIVGGGLAKINGYDLLLTDRLNIWRPKILSTSALGDIVAHLNGEVKANTAKRQALIEEAEQKIKDSLPPEQQQALQADQQQQQQQAEIELPEETIEKINNETELKLDIEYIDELIEKNGQHLPVTILPSPREFDPSMITWKGGSVYGRLKVVNEMWITQKDWDLLGSRCLYYKSIFNY
ncbi:Actin-like protein ARP8 [Candida viswanathii]|uniref:Actin-like protein ARP8 n=1 Tax=Candida viswanathii TaxID=5486 RepID=A0A367XQA7_9ASCO|nr:Actin-like protein ARP8 [Candida viswanathii]